MKHIEWRYTASSKFQYEICYHPHNTSCVQVECWYWLVLRLLLGSQTIPGNCLRQYNMMPFFVQDSHYMVSDHLSRCHPHASWWLNVGWHGSCKYAGFKKKKKNYHETCRFMKCDPNNSYLQPANIMICTRCYPGKIRIHVTHIMLHEQYMNHQSQVYINIVIP